MGPTEIQVRKKFKFYVLVFTDARCLLKASIGFSIQCIISTIFQIIRTNKMRAQIDHGEYDNSVALLIWKFFFHELTL